jgi:ATP-binding cassette subfamily B protein
VTLRHVLARLLGFQPWHYAGNLVLQILRFGLLLAPGMLVRELFNWLTDRAPLSWGFWSLVALLAAVALARVAALLGAVALESRIYFRAAAWLRTNLFEALLRRPDARGLPLPSGEIANRLDADAGAMPMHLNGLFFMAGTAAGALIAVGLMLSINPALTLVVLLPMLATSLVVTAASARLIGYRRASRAAQGEVSAFLGEIFGAVQAIQVSGAEQRAVRHLEALNQTRQQAFVRERLFQETLLGPFGSFVDSISQIGIGLVLLLVGQQLRAGTFTVGDFALFVYALPRIGDFTLLLSNSIAGYRQTRVALERALPLLSGAPAEQLLKPRQVFGAAVPAQPPAASSSHNAEVQSADAPTGARVGPAQSNGGAGGAGQAPEAAQAALLEARGLSARYPGGGRGISGVDLALERGSLTIVVGRVGSGKTTLLRALLGLLPCDSGSLYWKGRLVGDPAAFFVPPRCAYVAQAPRLFSATLRENVLLGFPQPDSDAAEVALQRALQAAALDRDLATLDQGLDTVVGPRGRRLSGGQIQRAAVARALTQVPELLVLDDVSSALDVETEQVLWNRLLMRENDAQPTTRNVGAGGLTAGDRPVPTILAVSHRRAALQRAGRIIVLKDGCVVTSGRLPDLLEASAEMRELWTDDTTKE